MDLCRILLLLFPQYLLRLLLPSAVRVPVILERQNVPHMRSHRIDMPRNYFVQVFEFLIPDPERLPEGKGILLPLLPNVDVLQDVVRHLPRHGQMIRSFARRANDGLPLFQRGHDLLRLGIPDVMESRMDDNPLYVLLTRFHLLRVFLCFDILILGFVIVVGVLRRTPFVVLVGQIGALRGALYGEPLHLDFRNSTVNYLVFLNSFLRIRHVLIRQVSHVDVAVDAVVQAKSHARRLTRTRAGVEMIPHLRECKFLINFCFGHYHAASHTSDSSGKSFFKQNGHCHSPVSSFLTGFA